MYSKGVMAPSPSVPGLAIVPVLRHLRNGSLSVYRLGCVGIPRLVCRSVARDDLLTAEVVFVSVTTALVKRTSAGHREMSAFDAVNDARSAASKC